MTGALWCLYPATGILVMPYTEALAGVLIAGSLLLLMQRRYAWVAVLVLALGFTRAAAPAHRLRGDRPPRAAVARGPRGRGGARCVASG